MSIKTRPFRVLYGSSGRKVGRVCACGSVEGVVRSVSLRLFMHSAETASVYLDGALFAKFVNSYNRIDMEVL